MVHSEADYEARLAALEARLAEQGAEIDRLRRRSRMAAGGRAALGSLRPWLLALVGFMALFLVGGVIVAAPPDPKAGETAGGPQSTGGNLIIGVGNAPTSPTDTTSLFNPSVTALMTRTLRVANYTGTDISADYRLGFRTALVGSTSGNDNTPGVVTRVGVMGMVDQSGYGVYGVSLDGSGVMGRSHNSAGVVGASDLSTGGVGTSTGGIGGQFSGATSQVRLVPGSTPGPPVGGMHSMGELYLGSTGNLYLCTLGGVSSRWAKLNLLQSFLPALEQ